MHPTQLSKSIILEFPLKEKLSVIEQSTNSQCAWKCYQYPILDFSRGLCPIPANHPTQNIPNKHGNGG